MPDSDPARCGSSRPPATRQRTVIRSLRELCFALEPWVLRDQGFVDRHGGARRRVRTRPRGLVELDVEPAGDLLRPTTRCACTRSCARRSPTPSSTPAPIACRVAVSGSARGRLRGASCATTAPGSPTRRRTTASPTTAWPSMRERARSSAGGCGSTPCPARAPSCASRMPPLEASDVRRQPAVHDAGFEQLVAACEAGLDLPAILATASRPSRIALGAATAAYTLLRRTARYLRLVGRRGRRPADPPSPRSPCTIGDALARAAGQRPAHASAASSPTPGRLRRPLRHRLIAVLAAQAIESARLWESGRRQPAPSRPAHRPPNHRGFERALGPRAGPRHAQRRPSSRWPWSTWTGSRPRTTAAATPPATRSCAPPRAASRRACAPTTTSPGSAATSSGSSCPAWRREVARALL